MPCAGANILEVLGTWSQNIKHSVFSFLRAREGNFYSVTRFIELRFLYDAAKWRSGGRVDLKPYVVKGLVFSKKSGQAGRFLASYDTHGGW